MTQPRFEAGSLRDELLRLNSRLENVRFESRLRERLETSPEKPRKRRGLLKKLRDFWRALAHLPRLARRVSELAVQQDAARDALASEMREFGGRLEAAVGDQNAALEAAVADQNAALSENLDLLGAAGRRMEKIERALRLERLTRQKAYSELDRRLRVSLRPALAPQGETAPHAARSEADAEAAVAPLLQTFYHFLEERYRGTREEIKDRLAIYIDDLSGARERTKGAGHFVDLGCGRGEFLQLMRERDFPCVGVDLNDLQLDVARQFDLPVIHGDVLSYLTSLPDRTVAGVCAIHLIEHLPFPILIALAEQIERVLIPGGVVILETPNPRNLIVGAHTFNFDPTHVRPVPFEVTEILLETIGFPAVECRPLHASDTYDYMVHERGLDPDLAKLLFGPQDYAAVALKE